jgi:hypothetical protein
MTDSQYHAPASWVALIESSEEVIRLDKEGFHYRGEFIADAGEAHRLMVAFLQRQLSTQEPSAEWLEARENEMCKHSAWAEDGVLKMANNDDGYYVETFKSHQELEQFIAYLRLQANEAWPL